MSLTEKVAYIKGVISGMKFDTETNEGKIIELIVDFLDDIANDVTDVYENVETLNSYIEEIDEDLGYLEDVVYDELEDDLCDGMSDDCDCCTDDCDCDDCCDEEFDFFKVICPSCNEEVYLDNSIDPSRVFCPSCHNEFSAEASN